MDPADYLARDLVGLQVPAIVYRAVSKYPEQQLRSWLSEQAPYKPMPCTSPNTHPSQRSHHPSTPTTPKTQQQREIYPPHQEELRASERPQTRPAGRPWVAARVPRSTARRQHCLSR
jgi:hypothetical protein